MAQNCYTVDARLDTVQNRSAPIASEEGLDFLYGVVALILMADFRFLLLAKVAVIFNCLCDNRLAKSFYVFVAHVIRTHPA